MAALLVWHEAPEKLSKRHMHQYVYGSDSQFNANYSCILNQSVGVVLYSNEFGTAELFFIN